MSSVVDSRPATDEGAEAAGSQFGEDDWQPHADDTIELDRVELRFSPSPDVVARVQTWRGIPRVQQRREKVTKLHESVAPNGVVPLIPEP